MKKSYLKIKHILKNNFFLKILESLIGRASYILFNLVFTLICARLYGANLFGEYTYAFTFMQVVMIFTTLGFNNGLIYSFPKDGLKNVSFSFLLSSIVSISFIIIGLFIFEDRIMLLALPLIWMLSSEQLFFGLYKGQQKIKEYYLVNGFIHMIIRIVFVIFFYYMWGTRSINIIISVLIAYIASNIIYFRKNRHLIKTVVYDNEYVRYSSALIFVAILSTLLNRTDLLMIQWFLSSGAVGIYQVISQITSLLSSLLLVFNTVFAPEISRLYHKEEIIKMKTLYIKSTRILFIIAIFVIIIISGLSQFILGIFGSEFIIGETTLWIRLIGYFFNISVGGVWFMLSMTGNPRYQMVVNSIAVIMNIVLNLTLIPMYGLNGAAVATTVTMIFSNVTGYIIISKKFDLKVFRYF